MTAPLSLHEVLAKLRDVRPHGDNYQAKCPAHEDGTASLSVSTGREGRILLKCFAGCDYRAICGSLGIVPAQLMPPREPQRQIGATYDYRDANGVLLFQKVRYIPKKFDQRRPDGRGGWIGNLDGITRVPYRLNELKGHSRIYVVEGEKDADACWTHGRPATTITEGAGKGKWKKHYSETLKALGVEYCLLVPDNDEPGYEHMADVAQSLTNVGIKATIVELRELPIKEDISYWLANGHTLAEIEARASKIPIFTRPLAAQPLGPDPHGSAKWAHTDVGAAESFVSRFGDKLRFNHKHKEWLIWNCHHWRLDNNEEIRRKARDHVRTWQQEAALIEDYESKTKTVNFAFSLERSARLSTFVDLARSEFPITDAGEDWDHHPLLLGCPNGVVELSTGQLRPGHPSDKITLQVGTPFDADAQCPLWLSFLDQIFEEKKELIPFVQRAAGYSLSGDTREQCFFMLVGQGANGKSTFLSVLGAVWGDYGYTADMSVFASANNKSDSSRFDMAELLARRLVMVSETKVQSRMNEQSIKNFTGGEKQNAQKKFGHPFVFQPVGKLWMGVNHQPKVVDDSHGFWRRVRLIPFEQTFSGSRDNRKLKAELIAEAPGILAWAVQGARLWLTDGLSAPDCVMTATEAYRDDQDPLRDFLHEQTEVETGAEVSCSAAYLAYREWAKDQGITEREVVSRKSFGYAMNKRFERKHTSGGDRYVALRVKVRRKDLFETV